MYRPALEIALVALAVAGCSAEKASERAKREYRMMERGGASQEDMCAKRREIAEAYLKEGNEREFWLANIEARNTCRRPHF